MKVPFQICEPLERGKALNKAPPIGDSVFGSALADERDLGKRGLLGGWVLHF